MRTFFLCCLLILSLQGKLRAQDTSIIVCDNGLEMFHWDLDFIKEAKQSVEILACFFGGEIAQELLLTVEERLCKVPSLQVYLLASPILLSREDKQLIRRLQENYPNNFHIEFSTQVVKFRPDLTSIDNHVKMFVVDEYYFSAGGTNLEEAHCAIGTFTPDKRADRNPEIVNHLPSGMRDQDIVGRGSFAKTLREHFYRLYALWENYNQTYLLEQDPGAFSTRSHYFPITDKAFVERFEMSKDLCSLQSGEIRAVFGGPHQKKNAITEEYVRLINEAKEEIILEHLYFFPVDPIFNALMEAVNRGVHLTIITNGLSSISPEASKIFCWANRLSYVPMFYGRTFHCWDFDLAEKLKPKNTRIYEYHVEDIVLHKKVMIVDKKTLLVGSYNFGFKSAYGDYELALVITSEDAVKEAFQVHLRDVHNSRKITSEEACYWYFDPIKAYIGGLQRKYNGFL